MKGRMYFLLPVLLLVSVFTALSLSPNVAAESAVPTCTDTSLPSDWDVQINNITNSFNKNTSNYVVFQNSYFLGVSKYVIFQFNNNSSNFQWDGSNSETYLNYTTSNSNDIMNVFWQSSPGSSTIVKRSGDLTVGTWLPLYFPPDQSCVKYSNNSTYTNWSAPQFDVPAPPDPAPTDIHFTAQKQGLHITFTGSITDNQIIPTDQIKWQTGDISSLRVMPNTTTTSVHNPDGSYTTTQVMDYIYPNTGTFAVFLAVLDSAGNNAMTSQLDLNVGGTGTASASSSTSSNPPVDAPICSTGDIACYITTGLGNLFSSISDFFSGLFNGISTILGNIFSAIGGIVSGIVSALSDTVGSIWSGFGDVMSNLFVPTGSDIDTIFQQLTVSQHGLFDIITAPLTAIQTLNSTSCTPIALPLPYVGSNLSLPCMSSWYSSAFGEMFTMYQLIASGAISYWILVNFLHRAKEFKDPKKDSIEVINL